MIAFDQQFFKKEKFSKEQIRLYLESAQHALDIAKKDPFPEVQFDYAYKALIKIGIAPVANHGYRVRSVPGHHIKIMQKLAEILKDDDVFETGNAMRLKRNEDFYGCGDFIGAIEAGEFLHFVETVYMKANL